MAAKAKKADEPRNKRLMIRINKIPGQKVQDDVIISVNGERYQIQRGVNVEVPEKVAAAFRLWQRECEDAEKVEFDLMYEG
jgi:hypothetical protein